MPTAIERADALRERADRDLWSLPKLGYRVALGVGIGAIVGAVDPEQTVTKRASEGAVYGFAYHTVSSIYGIALAKIAQRAARSRGGAND